jgi:hypothetical protein
VTSSSDSSAAGDDSSSSSSSPSPRESNHDSDLEWVLPVQPCAKLHRSHPSKLNALGGPRPVCCNLKLPPSAGRGFSQARAMYPDRSWCTQCCADLAQRISEE